MSSWVILYLQRLALKKSGHFFSGDDLSDFEFEVFSEIASNFAKLERDQLDKEQKKRNAKAIRKR